MSAQCCCQLSKCARNPPDSSILVSLSTEKEKRTSNTAQRRRPFACSYQNKAKRIWHTHTHTRRHWGKQVTIRSGNDNNINRLKEEREGEEEISRRKRRCYCQWKEIGYRFSYADTVEKLLFNLSFIPKHLLHAQENSKSRASRQNY